MKTNKYLFIKVFLPFLLGFSIIGFVSIFSLERLNSEHQKIRTNQILNNIQKTYENKIKQNYHIYNEIVHHIQSDPMINKYYLQKDREKLYEYTSKLFTRLNKEFQVTHFYFHDLDKKNFLRVHNSNLHSDSINRITLNNAEKTKDISCGIEFGILHNLTSRYVEPYYIKDKIVGYIELGEDIDYLTPYLAEMLDAQILIAIKKDLIDLRNINLSEKTKEKIKNYPETKKYYIINSKQKTFDKNITELIDGKVTILDAQKSVGNNYEVGLIKLYDLKQKEVGELIVLINAKGNKTTLIKLKTQLSFLIFIIALIIVSIYYLYLKNTTRKLDKSTKDIIKLTNTDQLTTLYNRRFFNKKLPTEIKKAMRLNKAVSFLMLDVDSFKLYNDNYGHLSGDLALKRIAKVLRKTVKRSSDIAFRMGGEEFCVFIMEENNDKISGPIIARKILEEVYDLDIEHIENEGHEKITVSIGISIKKGNEKMELDTLYKEADIALYEAKTSGKNKLVIYDEKN